MNHLEIDLKKLRENDIPTDMAINPPFAPWQFSKDTQRALSTITEYSELANLCQKLELEEMLIAYEYVKKLIESRPR